MPLVREFTAQSAFDSPEAQLPQTVEALLELCGRVDCDACAADMTLHG
jgi:hypothetical protein